MKSNQINPLETIIDHYLHPRTYGLKKFLAILSFISISLQLFNYNPSFLYGVLFISLILFSLLNFSLYQINFSTIQNYISIFNFKKYSKKDILPALLFSESDIKSDSLFSFPNSILVISIGMHLVLINPYLLAANILFIWSHHISANKLLTFVQESIEYAFSDEFQNTLDSEYRIQSIHD